MAARHGQVPQVEVGLILGGSLDLAMALAGSGGRRRLGAYRCRPGQAREQLLGAPAHRIVRRGIALVPEGRRIFPSLTVDENLRVAEDPHRRARGRGAPRWTRERVYELFPDLGPARRRGGHQISGGQQQMLAIGRALLSGPRLLLLDEVSLGLSPVVVKVLYQALARIRADGVTLVFVEQDVHRALAFSDHLVCLHKGTVRLSGASRGRSLDEVRRAYFG
jgi:branched-chain amino acid transport system ATP-binding protein